MVVSNTTAETIIRIVKANVDEVTFRRIMEELKNVPGNKSFRDTIEKLDKMSK